jgi:hypothetical protein
MTDWDAQIVADLEAEVALIEKAIEGKQNGDYVRLPRGDARPFLVGAHRTTIQIKRREIAAIRKQYA